MIIKYFMPLEKDGISNLYDLVVQKTHITLVVMFHSFFTSMTRRAGSHDKLKKEKALSSKLYWR